MVEQGNRRPIETGMRLALGQEPQMAGHDLHAEQTGGALHQPCRPGLCELH
ncbi:MAG: hypothetical protein H6R00_3418 [Proteobacteria bacterium]|nr:hypothetical protein [Pseudomonadota bacterium]